MLFFLGEGTCLLEGSGCRRRIPGVTGATQSVLASVGGMAHTTPSMMPRACVCVHSTVWGLARAWP